MEAITEPGTDIIRDLLRIGAIQFGQFERADQEGVFDPVAINLRLVPSFPDLLDTLVNALVPAIPSPRPARILPMPAVVPLATLLSHKTRIPLVYPADRGSHGTPHIEGAYEVHVSTLLITDVFRDGAAETTMIRHVRGLGLDVHAVLAVISLHDGHIANANDEIPKTAWYTFGAILSYINQEIRPISPTLQTAVRGWLEA